MNKTDNKYYNAIIKNSALIESDYLQNNLSAGLFTLSELLQVILRIDKEKIFNDILEEKDIIKWKRKQSTKPK